MQKLLYITFLALLPTIAWWILFYKKDPRKKRIKEMSFVFLMGTMSIAPVYGYQIFSVKYLPEISKLFPVLNSNPLLLNLVNFVSVSLFVLFCILLIAILHATLRTFLSTFCAFFKMSFNLWPVMLMVFFLLIIKVWISQIFKVDLLDNLIGIAMVSAVLEEYVKHLIVPVVGDKKIKNINTAIMYSIDVGLAFAFVENILYFISVPTESLLTTFLFRALFTTLGHVSFSAIFGYFYGRALFAEPILAEKEIKHRQFAFLRKIQKIFGIKKTKTFEETQMVNGLLVATFVHTFYNLLLSLNILILPIILLLGCYFIIDYLLHLEETNRQYGLIGTNVISEKAFHDLKLQIDVLKALKEIRQKTNLALETVPVKITPADLNLRKRLIWLFVVLIVILGSGYKNIISSKTQNYSANVLLVHHHLIEMADEIEKEQYEEYLHEKNIEIEKQIELFKNKNLDSDQDGLKDFEEEYFETDKNSTDTDKDGYSDYMEIQKGYNPTGDGKKKEENLDDIFHKIFNQ